MRLHPAQPTPLKLPRINPLFHLPQRSGAIRGVQFHRLAIHQNLGDRDPCSSCGSGAPEVTRTVRPA